ncbi:hypothetical protein [Curvibacter sp. PAE-UM]|uniref:hypothetical protein n=1 Tax=Curvibacter sp. PAE-UM TaxID=1714344 RepID=UPI000AB78704|nr:hypothetical protein [Curvibacter sp. PAE-UM]
MHVIVGLLVAALLGYLVYRAYFASAAATTDAATPRSERGVAFLSNGQLFCRERGGELKQVHSTYVQEVLDRLERTRERHSWKKGTSFGIAAGGGMRSFEAGGVPLLVTSAAYEANGNLLYFLKDEAIGGLFRREAASGTEQRVLLKQNLHLGDLNPSPEGGLLAASARQTAGVANIVLLKDDGANMRELTGGDSVDCAPAWIPGASNRLLFQSSGLARNAEGYIVAQGPASIQKLDMESGSVTPILDDPRYDHLKPRVSPAGDLLYIRRPFEAPHYGYGSMLADTLLFPFRLLRAAFHYLNFFSLMYSRKPLTSANGPAVQADVKNILLQGRRVDAEKAVRSARPVQGVPSLVPDSWELVRRDQQGAERVLATNVASYDISPDGTIIYSNGRGVFVLSQEGTPQLVLRDELVAEVVAAID